MSEVCAKFGENQFMTGNSDRLSFLSMISCFIFFVFFPSATMILSVRLKNKLRIVHDMGFGAHTLGDGGRGRETVGMHMHWLGYLSMKNRFNSENVMSNLRKLTAFDRTKTKISSFKIV